MLSRRTHVLCECTDKTAWGGVWHDGAGYRSGPCRRRSSEALQRALYGSRGDLPPDRRARTRRSVHRRSVFLLVLPSVNTDLLYPPDIIQSGSPIWTTALKASFSSPSSSDPAFSALRFSSSLTAFRGPPRGTRRKHDPVPLSVVQDRVNSLLEERKITTVGGFVRLPDDVD